VSVPFWHRRGAWPWPHLLPSATASAASAARTARRGVRGKGETASASAASGWLFRPLDRKSERCRFFFNPLSGLVQRAADLPRGFAVGRCYPPIWQGRHANERRNERAPMLLLDPSP